MALSEEARLTRLSTFFHGVINDKRSLSTARDGKLFVEAICAQPDPAVLAHKLITSTKGLGAIQSSVRFDTSIDFLNGSAVQLLRYLQDPSLGTISGGSVLAKILRALTDPPFFWDSLIQAFHDGVLCTDACAVFAWLLYELICLPEKTSTNYMALASTPELLEQLLKSPDGETRNAGQKIKHTLSLNQLDLQTDTETKPGGRHDNDHADHRLVSIMPTADEILSKERPFLRVPEQYLHDPELISSRLAIHIDNQFRLLREDMVGELREEYQKLQGTTSGHHRGTIVKGLRLVGIDMGIKRKRQPWGITLQCSKELPQLSHIQPNKRKAYLDEHRQILRQGTIACLLVDNEPVAFPVINRVEDQLAKTPAMLTVQFQDSTSMNYALLRLRMGIDIRLVQLDTSVFAYEPILKRLQDMKDVSFSKELLHWSEDGCPSSPPFAPSGIIEALENMSGKDLKDVLGTAMPVMLDHTQIDSLRAIISQRISLIQGPPGSTGKSFIGALGAKVMYDHTKEAILVVCYTNHALDQFLEDLMDIGIPSSSMVRLGAKSSDRTKPLSLREQAASKLSPTQWNEINKLEERLARHEIRLREAFARYQTVDASKKHLMEFLEFLPDVHPFFDAFFVPNENEDGMKTVGPNGKGVSPFFLLDRWTRGSNDAAFFQQHQPSNAESVWSMSMEKRQACRTKWRVAILDDLVAEVTRIGSEFNADQAELNNILSQRDADVIKVKRIIACTTTAAAKYSVAIQAASPGIVLVEEAGEILEAHIFSSLSRGTQQLILIGDHKQLRPKCKSYGLSVEQGDGFNLNESLFERLVRQGFPHTTLSRQHRMRPEISSIIRSLTYPELTDADSTLNRPELYGFDDNVIFVNHSHPEEELKIRELRDENATSSKQNQFEVEMILKCVKYLAQQGFGSDKLVVLTPYLGQLKLLRDNISKENDPILNDLDKFDLIRAGLLPEAESKASKPSLRLSTVDNYQGEESDIVLVSLTRSNDKHDIGFMSAPERLNVLISRARNGLIMIGNSETFIHARKGQDIWRKFFDHLRANNHIYEGFPLKCLKHPDRKATIISPVDFETQCPDGGCKEPCGEILKCGTHRCRSSCHPLIDHSKMRCLAPMTQNCPNGHVMRWQCHAGPAPLTCAKCEREKKVVEKAARKDAEAQTRRDEKLVKHQAEMSRVQDALDQVNQSLQDRRLDDEQQAILQQKLKDLTIAKERAELLSSQRTALEAHPRTRSTQHSAGYVPPHVIVAQPQSHEPPPSSLKPLAPAPSPNHTPASSTPVTILMPDLKPQVPETTKPSLQTSMNQSVSQSKIEWQRQKDQESATNVGIDDIMEMIGLEKVKFQVLAIKSKIDTSLRQGTDIKKERMGLVLQGNPGTGKTTVARHYAVVLASLGALSGRAFVETTGAELAYGGISEVMKHLKTLEAAQGGVYFVDEAYQLTESHNHGGKAVLDFLLTKIEDLVGSVVFVFAGYRKEMEKFFEHNPGLPSRIPYTLHFDDYSDAELLEMLQYNINKFFNHSMKIEGGQRGLYLRVAVRRLGRGRGRNGFGNARALETVFAKVRERQSLRLTEERKQGHSPDDYLLTKEDIIGPDPSTAIMKCEAWDTLQQMIGLKSVKQTVETLIDLIQANYRRELLEKPIIQCCLNRVFLGSPGTGKTSVAKLYGQILAAIGVLSNGEVVIKNPSDFIGAVIGASEENTKKILATTVGKVLIIDEAYMLSSGTEGSMGNTDVFKRAVIDTLVAEVQSVVGEDRCVLLLGYEDKMKEMFQNANEGLTRRFDLKEAFMFEDFTNAELEAILRSKLQTQGLDATEPAISVAIDCLDRARNGLNFGNGGDVENIISKAKQSYQKRQSQLPRHARCVDFIFEPEDFDPDFDRASVAGTNLQELFKGVIGAEQIIDQLQGYIDVARGMRLRGMEPRGQIPMNFVFKGPPGTGKTTTARKFGQVFYDLGFLSTVEVVECSASDLIGQYLGQTGPKTIKKLEEGLGKVLFIDEAYRLGQGNFAQEAIDQLVDSVTKLKFMGKMVIVLAGYDDDMNSLLRVNEGLSSRFPDEVIFRSLDSDHCLQVLDAKLQQKSVAIPALQDPGIYKQLKLLVDNLSQFPAWGNARDMETLAKSMVRAVYTSVPTESSILAVSDAQVFAAFTEMLKDKERRSGGLSKRNRMLPGPPAQASAVTRVLPPPQTNSSTSAKPAAEEDSGPGPSSPTSPTSTANNRYGYDDLPPDSDVSDVVWNRLQADKRAAELYEKNMQQELRAKEDAFREAAAIEEAAVQEGMRLEREEEAFKRLREQEQVRIRAIEHGEEQLRKRNAENESAAREQLRLREEARIRESKARAETERLRKEWERIRLDEQQRRQKDAEVQTKLRQMGVCVQGFRWTKQGAGYRCAGGSHYIPNSSLGI